MTLAFEIAKFIEQWVSTVVESNRAIAEKDFSSLRKNVTLQSTNEPGNFISPVGYKHLEEAARLLLREQRLSQKLALRTAVDSIVKAHFELLPKARVKKSFSEEGVANRSRAIINATPRASGVYVYPLVFAPLAKNTDWGFGPFRILSKAKFLKQYDGALQKERQDLTDTFRSKLLTDWEKHTQPYDHFALVNVADHEAELAEKVGREVAEFALNLIRMYFRFYHTDDIRIGGGYIFESERSSLYFTEKGEAFFTSARGPFGTHLDDSWTERIDYALGQMLPMFGSYLDWFVGGNSPGSPVLERIRYASALIAEAYSEPHDHIRLVRLISALEAFALVGNTDKAYQLSLTCGLVGGRGDVFIFNGIFDAVKAAYRVRNAIVHGDRPEEREVQSAFLGLERYALDIFVAFVNFFENVQVLDGPQSIKALRRSVKRRAPMYFWMPEVA
jgi:hypothetical protein